LNFAWGQMKKELRAYGLELRDSLIWVMLLWVCTTGHLTRRRKLMRPSTKQLQAASQSQALVLMGDFNHPDISWEDHTARQVQSRKFLQSIDDNFLMQVVEEPTRKGALLDLVLTNKEGLVEDVKVGGRLACSDHEMVEFRILHAGSRVISRIKILDFRRANFGLFTELLGGIPCASALKGRRVQDCWSLFKRHFLHA